MFPHISYGPIETEDLVGGDTTIFNQRPCWQIYELLGGSEYIGLYGKKVYIHCHIFPSVRFSKRKVLPCRKNNNEIFKKKIRIIELLVFK